MPRLTLNLGLRYEYNGIPRDENLQALNAIANDPSVGLIFRKPKPDKNNFMPRIGFAWDPTGHGKWAVRGGAGVAFDVVPNNFAINSLPPQLQTEQNPVLTCALAGAPQWCMNFNSNNPTNPAQGQGFLQFGGLLQVNVPPVTAADAAAATQSFIPDAVAPKVFTWSLGVQHELFRNSSLEVRYVGTRSLELPVQQRLNSASAFDPKAPGGGITPLPTYMNASDVPGVVTAPVSTLATFDAFNPQPLSGQGFFGSVTTFPPIGNGIYHGVSADFIHRAGKGLYLRANYTFSKNIDNATNELFSSFVNPRRAQDGFDFANERGRSALDLTHKFALSFLYEIPNITTGNGFLKAVAHGWEWGGSYLAQTGQPVTALSGSDANDNGDTAGDRTIFNPAGVGMTGSAVNAVCNAGPGGSTSIVGVDPATGAWQCGIENDANIVGYVVAPAVAGTDAGPINPTARFVQAQVGSVANVGRNTISTPGLNVWNMSLFKTTKLSERFTLQFRVETYDTFNHRNFSIGLPTNNGAIDQVTNPNPLSTGYIFVTSGNLFLNSHQFNGGSRTMQLGLRLAW